MNSASSTVAKAPDSSGVVRLLSTGMRLRGAHFDLRFGMADGAKVTAKAGLIISVPKRLLKSAVQRNRVKRLVRETFRAGNEPHIPISILVVYRSALHLKQANFRANLRSELGKLLRDGLARVPSVAQN